MRRECLPWAISGSRFLYGIRAEVRTVELSVFLCRGCGGAEYQERRDVRLARELAELTGDTRTGASTAARRERLERERRIRHPHALARELHGIGQRCASLLRPGPSAVRYGDLLFDERGYPG